jgi:hypothetical protein
MRQKAEGSPGAVFGNVTRWLAGRRYVATGTAAAAVSIIVTTSPGWDTIAT